MIQVQKLNHICITAPPGQEKKARWFYKDILELCEIPIPEKLKNAYELLWFSLPGGNILHISFENTEIQSHIHFEQETIIPGPHIALEILDCKEARQILEKQGIITYDPVKLSHRNRFYGIDPFGNCIEFTEKES